MRYLVIPDDVQIVDRKSGQPVLFRRSQTEEPQLWKISHESFLTDFLLPHSDLLRGGVHALRRALKLEKLLSGCKPGDVIPLEDADYLVLRGLLEKIEWPPQFARFAVQMLPHLEAWERADRQNDAWIKARDPGKVEYEKAYQERVEKARERAFAEGAPIGEARERAFAEGAPISTTSGKAQPDEVGW